MNRRRHTSQTPTGEANLKRQAGSSKDKGVLFILARVMRNHVHANMKWFTFKSHLTCV